MAFDLSYADVETFRARRILAALTDDGDNTRFADLLASASRVIDTWCGRLFGQSDGAETRVFTAASRTLVEIDDLISVDLATGVDVDLDGDLVCETTWTWGRLYLQTLPQHLLPDPAPSIGLRLALPQNGWGGFGGFGGGWGMQGFPLTPRGISLTGVWGWPSVPAPVKEACLRLALRLDKLPEAPLGIAQAAQTVNNTMGGTRLITPDDQDVRTLLAPFVRRWSFV